tara:strand:+ start:506 stop:703 length:198 start_codon:yes stop_codon:yes gene_type:complete
MLIGFILLVIFGVFIRMLRRKTIKYGGTTGRRLLKIGDTISTITFVISIAIFIGVLALLSVMNKK